MSMRDGESLQVPTLLFGTGNGVIGVLASLPKDVTSSPSACRRR